MSRKHSKKLVDDVAFELKKTIDANPLTKVSYEELLPGIEIGRKRILSAFREITGFNFITYLRLKRMEAAAVMLLSGRSIKEVTITCGYNSYVGNFSRDFKAVFSKGPAEWLKDQAGNGKSLQMQQHEKEITGKN